MIKPRQVKVHSRQANRFSKLQYPIVEGFLAARGKIQPFVHNVKVSITTGSKTYDYMVFFKRHCTFTPNKCIRQLLRGIDPVICSDVIVMRLGKSSYVNMRGRDRSLADFAVQRYLFHSHCLIFTHWYLDYRIFDLTLHTRKTDYGPPPLS